MQATIVARPRVWAVVNGKEITRDEVEKNFRSRMNAEDPEPSQEEALSLKLSVLDELINNEILLERAREDEPGSQRRRGGRQFTEPKSPYTEEEFQKQLKDTGLTVDDLKSDIRRQLSVQKLLNREVVAKISITDQDVKIFTIRTRSVQCRRAAISHRADRDYSAARSPCTTARTTRPPTKPKPGARSK